MTSGDVSLLVLVALIAAGIWFWLDSLKAREIAVAEGTRRCELQAFQFLDWTVAQTKLRLARNGNGELRFLRRYAFEYSETGNDRHIGSVTMLGRRIESTVLEQQLIRGANVIPLH